MGRQQRHEAHNERLRIADNIRKRRETLGMSQAQLAVAIGLKAAQTVSSIEHGERSVKASELVAIAKALFCDMADLLAEPTTLPEVAWRERPADGAEVIEARFIQMCENYALVEEWTGEESECDLPAVKLPTHGTPSFKWAQTIAETVHRVLDLGSQPAASLHQTLEETCGVKIFFLPKLQGSAACARGGFGAGIALNADEARWRRNFSLAHELFHLVTWDLNGLGPERIDSMSGWAKQVERLANAFASSLLLPKVAVQDRIKKYAQTNGITWESLVVIAREFDVSTEALLWRLVVLDMLTEETVNALRTDEDFRAFDRSTFGEQKMPGMLPERFLRLLELAYQRGEVSSMRVAEMTQEPLAEVHRRLARLDEDDASAEKVLSLA